jgi:hypothetical protein
MSTTCRGCRLPGVLVDEEGVCHDCARELAEDPELTVDDLRWVMPGPE